MNLEKVDGDDIGLDFDTMDSKVLLVSNLGEILSDPNGPNG